MFVYLALGFAALAAFIWLGGKGPKLQKREWRLASGGFAALLIAGAGIVAFRGLWLEAAGMGLAGAWLAVAARKGGAPGPRLGRSKLSDDEARSVLGVAENATPEEIQAAYTRLMRMAHPDKGGTSGLAAQLNAARDRLLRK